MLDRFTHAKVQLIDELDRALGDLLGASNIANHIQEMILSLIAADDATKPEREE